MTAWAEERERMVRDQIVARGIKNARLIAALRRIERHRFVPDMENPYSYDDRPLPIGFSQTISQPYIVALMTELLDLNGKEKILEVGSGSGYQTALLAELGGKVYAIERIGELQERAQTTLSDLGYGRVHFRIGDGSTGWGEAAPFDRILIAAAAPDIPKSLTDQLAVDGKMVIPVGSKWQQMLYLIQKSAAGALKATKHGGCVFVPLIGQEGWSAAS